MYIKYFITPDDKYFITPDEMLTLEQLETLRERHESLERDRILNDLLKGVTIDLRFHRLETTQDGNKMTMRLVVESNIKLTPNLNIAPRQKPGRMEDIPSDAFQSSKWVEFQSKELNPNKGLGIIPDPSKPSYK